MKFLLYNIGKLPAVLIVILMCSIWACERRSALQSEIQAEGSIQQVKETLLFEIPWGSGKGLIGFLPRTESTEDQGPVSFFVEQQGNIIYVLDTINRRVNIYEGGKFSKEVKLISGYYPTDIFVDSEAIYVLTNMAVEKLLRKTGVTKSQIIVGPEQPLKRAEKIFKVDNTIVVSSWGDTRAGAFACFDDASLKQKSCESIPEIYTHQIIDVDSNNKFIAYQDRNLIYVSKTSFESIGPIPDVEELYPAIRLFRVSSGKIYIMRPTEKSVSFYVLERL